MALVSQIPGIPVPPPAPPAAPAPTLPGPSKLRYSERIPIYPYYYPLVYAPRTKSRVRPRVKPRVKPRARPRARLISMPRIVWVLTPYLEMTRGGATYYIPLGG